MVSPVQQSPATEQCLHFYYMVLDYGSTATADTKSPMNLSVYILSGNRLEASPAWSAVGGGGFQWEYATVPISLKEPYRYSFVASKGGSLVLFLLDDISVRAVRCPTKLSCTFTDGTLCDWTTFGQHGPLFYDFYAWLAETPYPEIRPGAYNVTDGKDMLMTMPEVAG